MATVAWNTLFNFLFLKNMGIQNYKSMCPSVFPNIPLFIHYRIISMWPLHYVYSNQKLPENWNNICYRIFSNKSHHIIESMNLFFNIWKNPELKFKCWIFLKCNLFFSVNNMNFGNGSNVDDYNLQNIIFHVTFNVFQMTHTKRKHKTH